MCGSSQQGERRSPNTSVINHKALLFFQTNWFRHIFNFGLSKKTDELYKGIVRRNSIWDLLIFWLVRNKVGGSVRLVITGSAPLKGNVLTFLR